jgi:hypothetical protein
MTFPAGQLPPVNAFWSITMYDGRTQLLIENPINRYLINSPMLRGLKKNPDGSLTIYVQKDSPGKDKESNWLPAPDGPMFVVMRLYWPKTEEPSVLHTRGFPSRPPARACGRIPVACCGDDADSIRGPDKLDCRLDLSVTGGRVALVARHVCPVSRALRTRNGRQRGRTSGAGLDACALRSRALTTIRTGRHHVR